MKSSAMLALTGVVTVSFLAPTSAEAQVPSSQEEVLREWEVVFGGRTRDPYVAPDGKVWFVGQAGNYVAWFDPDTEDFRRYEIEEGTNPHNLIVDDEGMVWYAGNRNGRIGKLDPETGETEIFMTGEARDPHTLIFDGKGNIWFTSQQSNYVGRMDMATGEYRIIEPHEERSRPYGIVMDDEGHPWVSLFNTNQVIRIDPETMEITSDGHVWYVDEPRGQLGRIHIETRAVTEFPMPGGETSRPYALTKDDRDVLWASQTGPEKRLVAFDPGTERFLSVNEVSHNIRHMMFDHETQTMWFGTDANMVGRILTRVPIL